MNFVSGLLVRRGFNVFQLTGHGTGTPAEAVNRVARRCELFRKRADHISVSIKFSLDGAQELPDLTRPFLQRQRPKAELE